MYSDPHRAPSELSVNYRYQIGMLSVNEIKSNMASPGLVCQYPFVV